MATRPLDVAAAAVALLPAVPLCLVAAAGIWLCDGRPVLYESRRVGRGGAAFTMYKFRTMRCAGRGVRTNGGGLITAARDSRVFAFGAWLRRWKIDELPQLVNVLRGDMAIIGPRPEDPVIVERFYTPLARETLAVRPGLASPGSIYNFTHGERQLAAAAADGSPDRLDPGDAHALSSGAHAGRADAAGADAALARTRRQHADRAGAADADAASTQPDAASPHASIVDLDDAYANQLLPRKLALDLVYVRTASVAYDLRIVCRAARTIVERGFGRCVFPDPPEMPRARQLEGLLQCSPVPPAELP